jgi:hypothetical protein
MTSETIDEQVCVVDDVARAFFGCSSGLAAGHVDRLRRWGVTAGEAFDAVAHGVDFPSDGNGFIYARDAGATHAEIIEVVDLGVGLRGYADALRDGATHAEVLDAFQRGHYLIDYADKRENGATHEQALNATMRDSHG